MKTIAIIVSYANRYELCRQVVESCLVEDVYKIIVVDNGSAKESEEQLKQLEQRHNSTVEVVRIPTNTGSSGGYKFGLECALSDNKADFLWLLDDDNVPVPGALKELVSAHTELSQDDERVVLYSYRGDSRPNDREAVTKGTIKQYLPNNFCGINITFTLRKKIRTLLGFEKATSKINHPIVKVKHGPYGGMFIRPFVVKFIGFPEERFFVYADDHEYTNRLDREGISQYLVYGSKLHDIDKSFPEGCTWFSEGISEFKVFYSIRNHTYLSGLFIENRLYYNANKWAYLIRLAKNGIPQLFVNKTHTLRRARIILRAIKDGENSDLGNSFRLP